MTSTEIPVSQPSAGKSGKARKRMTIFRASDASDVQDHMPLLGIDDSVRSGLSKLAEAADPYPVTGGSKAVVLFSEPGDKVLEFRNATRFHLKFQGNDETHWDRIATVLRTNSPRWQNEQPPTGG